MKENILLTLNPLEVDNEVDWTCGRKEWGPICNGDQHSYRQEHLLPILATLRTASPSSY